MARKILVVVFLLLVAGAGFLWFKTKGMVFDPAKVEELAARNLPGARPVPGCQGAVAVVNDTLQAAILAPSPPKAPPDAALQGSELRIMVVRLAQPPAGAHPLETAREAVADIHKQQQKSALQTLEKKPVVLKAGGHPQPFLRSLGQVAGGPKMVDYLTVFPLSSGTVVLVIAGPEATFNQTSMDQFLGGLQVPAAPLPAQTPPAAPPEPPGPPPGGPPALPPGPP